MNIQEIDDQNNDHAQNNDQDNDHDNDSHSNDHDDDSHSNDSIQVNIKEDTNVSGNAVHRYTILREVLPSADPVFLKKMSKRLLSEESLYAFVEGALQSNEYPKRDDYEKHKEFLKNWRKYIVHFNVEEFLRIIPNPVRHFASRKIRYRKEHCLIFLKQRYKGLAPQNLKDTFSVFGYDLVKVCTYIDRYVATECFFVRAKKFRCDLPLELIQEMAYIENRSVILRYIKRKEKKKKATYKTAKKNGELLVCECCFSKHVINNLMTCDDGHIFCKSCVKRGTEVAYASGNLQFSCYSDQCSSQFSLRTLEQVLDSRLFSRIVNSIQFQEVKSAQIEGLETCPFCTFCALPSDDDKLFKCLNAECSKVTCRLCKKLDHLPLTCHENSQRDNHNLRMAHYIEDKMTEALIRSCWKCQNKFVKEDGCNKMTCNVCLSTMCYVCRAPIEGYSHFRSHDNDLTKCPLWSSEKELHEINILNEGKRAKLEAEVAAGFALTNDPIKSFQNI